MGTPIGNMTEYPDEQVIAGVDTPRRRKASSRSTSGRLLDSGSITDVVATRTYTIDPIEHCGGGAVGDGKEEVAVVFFANAAPPKIATATLTLDNHNDSTSPPSFSPRRRPLR